MATIRFTKDHEWIRVDGGDATVGITAYAAEQLGDVVFVELPEVGKAVDQGSEAAVVESVKAASEVYAPVAGEVTAVNDGLNDDPAKVNADPQGGGWFFKMAVADASQLDGLMDETAYKSYVAGLD
jgi:glycine cleavage system H protein